MKTSELTGAALDWAVAKCEGEKFFVSQGKVFIPDWEGVDDPYHFCPSKTYNDGGPIIEREAISVAADTAGMFDSFVWFASVDDILVDADEAIGVRGPTPLVAAMRCYVASKLGDEVEIPEGLQ